VPEISGFVVRRCGEKAVGGGEFNGADGDEVTFECANEGVGGEAVELGVFVAGGGCEQKTGVGDVCGCDGSFMETIKFFDAWNVDRRGGFLAAGLRVGARDGGVGWTGAAVGGLAGH